MRRPLLTITDPANRLIEDENHIFEYDVNGNLIRKTVKASGATWRYSYTLYDELARASLHDSADPAAPEVSWSSWTYNAFGERSGAQHSDGREALYYYDNGNMVAETDTWLSNVVRWYTHSDATDDILADLPDDAPDTDHISRARQSLERPVDSLVILKWFAQTLRSKHN